MYVGVLGSLQVGVASGPVEIRRGLPRVLLSSLVLHRGDAVPFDVLVEQLWGDELPANPLNALQTQTAYLRRALGGAGVAPIETRPTGYALAVPADNVDVARFEGQIAEARTLGHVRTEGSLRQASERFDEALALWRGTPYADVADHEFARSEIVRLEELALTAREERAAVRLDLGRAAEVASELHALASAHPLRERIHELLVVALYRVGRQADALRAYERARSTLADELGIDPGPNLRELERRVLDQDPSLEWSPLPSADVVAPLPMPPSTAPTSPTQLIGRDAELERLRSLIDERPLLTLTGPGGAGKTRLAVELAATCDRVAHFVDLAPIEDPDVVGQTILAALDLPDTGRADALDELVTALAGQASLVVLDTCERVLAGVGPLVESLIAAVPTLRVLATSRRPLGLANELAWPVPPLDIGSGADGPAVTLFLRRARQVAPHFEVDDAGIEEVRGICRALDGLPLAIELAAAQMDVLTPAEVLAGLERGNPLSAAGPIGPRRHQTLADTIEWSIDLLDASERDLLAGLEAFPGTFDLEAAVAVAGHDEASSVATFLSLVRTSLVAPVPPGRYRLLDTVRSHLRERGEHERAVADAQRRLAEHFGTLAATSFVAVQTAKQSEWLPRLRAEVHNLRAALAWCFGPDGDEQLGARLAGDIAWAWTLQGNLTDARGALERAAEVDAPPAARARVLLGLGLLAAPLGDLATARAVCLESAELARRGGDTMAVAAALLTLGVAEWGLGDLDAAAAAHDEAIGIYDRLGELWGRTICRILRARTARDAGDLDAAEDLLADAVDDASSTGDEHVIALAYEQHARSALLRGDLVQARVAAEASLRLNEKVAYVEGTCAALGLLGRIAVLDGDDDAGSHACRSLQLARSIGHTGAQCEALEMLAELAATAGDNAAAADLLVPAVRMRDRHGIHRAVVDEERVATLSAGLREALGAEWDARVSASRLRPFDDVVQAVLESS